MYKYMYIHIHICKYACIRVYKCICIFFPYSVLIFCETCRNKKNSVKTKCMLTVYTYKHIYVYTVGA